jgi:hypothetical protein
MKKQNPQKDLDFRWANRQWTDIWTGAQVVCLTPDDKLHYRNPYFRVNMFCRDGTKMVIRRDDPESKERSAICSIDLLTGELKQLYEYDSLDKPDHGLADWAISPHSHFAHVIDTVDGLAHIIQIDLDTGEKRRILPNRPIRRIVFAECSADDRYLFSYEAAKEWDFPQDMPLRERYAILGSDPGKNTMYRIDLQDGNTEVLFEADGWWMGHSNPNPVDPNLFMCCQEGYIFTEEHPKPVSMQRQRIYDIGKSEWLDLQGKLRSRGTHEQWSFNGKRVYSHGWPFGCHAVYVNDFEAQKASKYIGPPGMGNSIHVTVAPDETFLVGDGRCFSRCDIGLLLSLGKPVTPDMSHPWDGLLNSDSPSEVIWKYELPGETVWPELREFQSAEDAHRAIAENPDKVINIKPLCRFRSRVRQRLEPNREEANAHISPDSRWAVFQSANEEGYYEVWAARVTGS